MATSSAGHVHCCLCEAVVDAKERRKCRYQDQPCKGHCS